MIGQHLLGKGQGVVVGKKKCFFESLMGWSIHCTALARRVSQKKRELWEGEKRDIKKERMPKTSGSQKAAFVRLIKCM